MPLNRHWRTDVQVHLAYRCWYPSDPVNRTSSLRYLFRRLRDFPSSSGDGWLRRSGFCYIPEKGF